MKSSLVAQHPSRPERTGYTPGGKTAIVVFGTSFKTSTLAFREALLADLERDSERLPRLLGAKEYAQVVTCNRIELVVATESPMATERAFLAWISNVPGIQATSVYVHRDLRAVSHLFQLAAGLDSMVVGEEQILSQVRSAGIAARRSKSSKGNLSALFDASVNVGKRARATLKATESVSSMSIRFALSRLPEAPKNVLLIGTGKTMRLAADQLGGAKLYVATRRRSLPSFPRASLVSHKNLGRVAKKCDLIVSATKHQGYVLKKGDLDGRRRIIIDLAFPRNVDPALQYGKTEVYNLDNLAQALAGGPREGTERAFSLVTSEAESFSRWLLASRQSSALSRLYQWAEKVRTEEADAAIRRLPKLSARERKVVEAMSKRMVSKLLAPATSFVKSSSPEFPQEQRLDLVSKIFDQGDEQ